MSLRDNGQAFVGKYGSKQQHLVGALGGYRRVLVAVFVVVVLPVLLCNSLMLSRHKHNASTGAAIKQQLKGVFARSCASQAAATKPAAAAAAALASQSRDLPKTGAGAPVLVTSNWDGAANRKHAEVPRGQLTGACGGHIFRYRVVDRVLYGDHNHAADGTLRGHRDTFVEMLLTAIWLYKDFPSVDLWVSFADEPSVCTLDVPVLQYALIGRNVTKQAAHNLAWEGGSPLSVAQLLTSAEEPARQSDPAPKFYRGWGIGYPFSWQHLSLLPDGLRAWQACMINRIGGRPYIPKLIWRGSNTGGRRGWAPQIGPAVQPLRHPWGAALTNKRMALSLLARSHPDIMDVGLHDLYAELMGPEGQDQQLVKTFKQLMVKPFVPQEQWGSYAAQLSIDGHGSPNRLPLQYLQGSSVVLKVTSPFKDWFEELFESGVHYLPVKYDLSDLVPRIEEVLARFKAGDTGGLETMASTAGAKAVEVFNILGQLDALVYAAQKIKSVCDWEVVLPPLRNAAAPAQGQVPGVSSAQEWEVVVFDRGRAGKDWMSPTLKAPWADGIRASMLRELPANFGASA